MAFGGSLFDGGGGMPSAWRLLMDPMDPMDQMDKMGAPVFVLTGYAVASLGIPRGFAVLLCGMARGEELPTGCARQLDGNGGMRVAWA